MASIESSPFPLTFPVSSFTETKLKNDSNSINIRTCTRSMQGMQKEALVEYGPSGKIWRMVCDEGPYLNGTDLAPFPLAYFTAGMVASLMSEVLALLKEKKISYSTIRLTQDNQYGMEGSAIKGTMTGSALPVEVKLELTSEADSASIDQLLQEAIAASPAYALLRDKLISAFSITLNGQPLVTKRVTSLSETTPLPPQDFDSARPCESSRSLSDIIIKNKAAETVFDVAGGAGTSLSGEQKRTLHVRGICTLREDGIKHIQVQLFKPIGSMFQFLSDNSKVFGGEERAPSGLAYLSAGLAFCYMTQLGRYSHIVKKPLDLYRIIQDTQFSLPGVSGKTGVPATLEPVKTHVYIDTSESDDYVQTLVDMSEQTCFLHAACRQSVKAKIKP